MALGTQGDETNHTTDVLTVSPGTKPEELRPNFKLLLDTPGRAPARAVFKKLGPWLAPSDPHFVKEFQNKHFDQRLWELYLWAVFRELGYDVTQPEVPDFHIVSPRGEFTVEATTCAPSEGGVLAEHPDPKNLRNEDLSSGIHADEVRRRELTVRTVKIDDHTYKTKTISRSGRIRSGKRRSVSMQRSCASGRCVSVGANVNNRGHMLSP